MAFLHLNIRGRLILGFGVLCALLACVVGVTIVKVDAVNESTDRTVNLRVPTAMTASDVVAGVYASLASLRGWLITGNDAFKTERATLWKDIQRARLRDGWPLRPLDRRAKQGGLEASQAAARRIAQRAGQGRSDCSHHRRAACGQDACHRGCAAGEAHAAKGDGDHRRGRRHCLDRCAQEPVDRLCRHARQHGDGDRCDPRLSA